MQLAPFPVVLCNGDYVMLRVLDNCELILVSFRGNSTDTFKTRLLGVTTDDSKFTRAARQRIVELTRGKRVRVRLDKRRVDNDRSFLAHVYVDEQLLSEQLVVCGFVRTMRNDSDNGPISRLLRKAEEQAKLARVGRWSGEE